MILLTLGQSRPIPNATVAMIIRRWLEGLRKESMIEFFTSTWVHAVNISTMRKQAKSGNPGGSVLPFPNLDLKNRYIRVTLSYVRQKIIVLSTFTLALRTSSIKGANVSSIVDNFSRTEYLMLVLLGDSATTTGFIIPSTWQIAFRDVFVAVAVRAIMLMSCDNKLLTSPRCANSLRKVSPLQVW